MENSLLHETGTAPLFLLIFISASLYLLSKSIKAKREKKAKKTRSMHVDITITKRP